MFKPSPAQEEALHRLVEVFLTENAKVNLSAHRTKEKVWEGNVMDSVAACELFSSHYSSIPLPLPPREEGGGHNNGWIKQVTPKNISLYARTMRKNPTEAEEVLWKLLRNDALGIRFRRQYPLGGRILDFYAPSIRLAIEADGAIHASQQAQTDDSFRSEYLADDHHIFTLRFSNDEILKQSNQVIAKIKAYIQKHTHPLPPVEEGLGMEGLRVGKPREGPGVGEKMEQEGQLNILDLGTGGGFPLLPLAILFPEHRFTGLDSVRKKTDAVGRIVAAMHLSNLTLVTGRAEECGHDPAHRERYDIVTARAVAETAILLEYCAPFVKVGGQIWLWKSMDIDDEISAASGAEDKLHLERKSSIIYELGGDWGQRQILVYEKIKATPKEYPRSVGAAKKHPL